MKRILFVSVLLCTAVLTFAQNPETSGDKVYDLHKISRAIYRDYHLKIKHAVDSVIYHSGVENLDCVVFDNVTIAADGTTVHEVRANSVDSNVNGSIERSVAGMKLPALSLYDDAGNGTGIDVKASFSIVSNAATEWEEYELEVRKGECEMPANADSVTLNLLMRFVNMAFYDSDRGAFKIRLSKFMVNSEFKLYDVAEIYKLRKKGADLLVRYDGVLFNALNPFEHQKSENNAKKENNYSDYVNPSFMGGNANKFSEWINQTLTYPRAASSMGIMGKVYTRFVVNSEGQVEDVTVTGPVHPSLDREAFKVIGRSPKWTPGVRNGKTVDVTYVFPIVFHQRRGGSAGYQYHTPEYISTLNWPSTIKYQ